MTALSATVSRLLALGGPGRHPASAIAGVRADEVTQVSVGGWAALPAPGPAGRAGVPMDRDLLVDLASVTKVAATTVLAMRLVADGQLDLAAPARRYLPSLTGEGKSEITAGQLLTHTAGLAPWWPLYFEAREPSAALDRAMALPLAARPGATWRYSDIGLILAGHLIEHITGRGLDAAFGELVAAPLGLAARYGPVPAGRAAASADSDAYEFGMIAAGEPYPVPFSPAAFSGWRDHEARGVVNDGNAAHALNHVAGHAGLFATVDDLLALGAALHHGDFIPRAVLERFAAATPVAPEQATGFRRRTLEAGGETLTLLWHGGFTGTFIGVALERDLVVAGGAMRLYGTVGPLPRDGAPEAHAAHMPGAAPREADAPVLVPGSEIHDALLDGARRVLAGAPSDRLTHPATDEER
jgi:CubicO group peptidase (beta-lactamase class C family)